MPRAITDRVRTYRSRWEQFGPLYATLSPLRRLASVSAGGLASTADAIEGRLLEIEGAHGVLGPAHAGYSGHSSETNRAIWSGWDWSKGGEEWNDAGEPEEWKAALIDEVLLPYLGDARSVLEIGPGAGRWSEVIQPRAERLVLVDITEATLDVCRERLEDPANVEYVLSAGASFPEVQGGSMDRVWSFDVFVHIAPVDVASYLADVERVLRPGGTALIHHSGRLVRTGGWRSPMTALLFARLAGERGLDVVRQFDSWSEDRFGVRANGDTITVLRKPGA
jgi:ubiquinone/menaquinone biosynthesis C-methylase UbiE